jgi:hypothetical protein
MLGFAAIPLIHSQLFPVALCKKMQIVCRGSCAIGVPGAWPYQFQIDVINTEPVQKTPSLKCHIIVYPY